MIHVGNSGLVVAATCNKPGLPVQQKRYAVKLLYNFSHEYSSVVNNSFENEWLILSRLLPHPNVVRFWAQFVSLIPSSFRKLLPEDLRAKSVYRDRSGVSHPRKGQFLVLDHHQQNLTDWMNLSSFPLSYDVTLRLTEQIMQALLYLEKNRIRHLDMKPSNILVAHEDRPILCDFGCAIQFPDVSFKLSYTRGMQVSGNKAHLAPEVLSSTHLCRHEPSRHTSIDYLKQASFALGVLVCEIATGEHPLADYPLGFTTHGVVHYTPQDLYPLPEPYPKSFRSIVGDLLKVEPDTRLSLGEAVKQLELCCVRRHRTSSTVGDLQDDLKRVKQERDLAKVGNVTGSNTPCMSFYIVYVVLQSHDQEDTSLSYINVCPEGFSLLTPFLLMYIRPSNFTSSVLVFLTSHCANGNININLFDPFTNGPIPSCNRPS